MGLKHISSCRSENHAVSGQSTPILNPDPSKFTIEKLQTEGDYIIVLAWYHGCTNFEGRKVLVYYGTTESIIRSKTSLDPHFCDDRRCLSPIARFEPTIRGWKAAVLFAQASTAQRAGDRKSVLRFRG